jgi:hypothetical protein
MGTGAGTFTDTTPPRFMAGSFGLCGCPKAGPIFGLAWPSALIPGKGDGTKAFIGAILKPKFCRLGEDVLGSVVTGDIDDIGATLGGVSSINICVGEVGDRDKRSLWTILGLSVLDFDGDCSGISILGL